MSDYTNRFSVTGKRALVTGATKGIGLEICRVLASAGADIAAVGRDTAGLEEARVAVESAERRCVTIRADLASAAETERAAAEALEAFGTVDILVNNAGIAIVGPALETSVADWDLVMAVNLRAPFILAKALAPQMIAQGSGKIINISSQTGVVGLDDHSAYSASKGGLNSLTMTLTSEWAKHNIQINAVCPTVILTPMGEQVWGDPAKGDPMKAKIPAARFGKPIEVADLVLFLASPASDLINGQAILIDGGFTAI
ncbi:MAG: glucose 1-dehydrogenase [Geminicoccaceae bacterium]